MLWLAVQAILQAAYLRQALQGPAASSGLSYGSAGAAPGSLAAAAGGSGGGARGEASEDCCESCRAADRPVALRDSKRQVCGVGVAAELLANGRLRPF